MKTEDPQNDLKLLSLNKTTKLLKISVTTLKKLINEGRINVITINKQIKIPYLELKRFIQENLTTVKFNSEISLTMENNNASENPIFNTDDLFNKLIQRL